jgi:hypothetical protein
MARGRRRLLAEPYVSWLGDGRRLAYFPQGDGVCCIALDPAIDAAAVRDALVDAAKRLRRGPAWLRAKEVEFGVSLNQAAGWRQIRWACPHRNLTARRQSPKSWRRP